MSGKTKGLNNIIYSSGTANKMLIYVSLTGGARLKRRLFCIKLTGIFPSSLGIVKVAVSPLRHGIACFEDCSSTIIWSTFSVSTTLIISALEVTNSVSSVGAKVTDSTVEDSRTWTVPSQPSSP